MCGMRVGIEPQCVPNGQSYWRNPPMADLKDLGKLLFARDREKGIRLIAEGSVIAGIERLEGLGERGFTNLKDAERSPVGEACILAGKHAQAQWRWAKALARFRMAVGLLPPQALIQERIHALQKISALPAQNPNDARVRADLGLSPGRVHAYNELSAVDEVHALGRYMVWHGNTDFTERIRDMKRRSHPELARHFAGLLAGYVARQPDLYGCVDLVVSVPPDPEKFTRRGYGPTDLMLEPLCTHLGIPFRQDTLSRSLGDEPTRQASPEQILESIRVNHIGPWIAAAREVLLLEDVVVAGKNINACAMRLKQAGARRVLVLALATTSG
jgi:predicted amidophosphoribosyltransferase